MEPATVKYSLININNFVSQHVKYGGVLCSFMETENPTTYKEKSQCN